MALFEEDKKKPAPDIFSPNNTPQTFERYVIPDSVAQQARPTANAIPVVPNQPATIPTPNLNTPVSRNIPMMPNPASQLAGLDAVRQGLPSGGTASLTGSLPDIPNGVTYNFENGGTVTLPQGSPAPTGSLEAQDQQARNNQELIAGIEARRIVKSLQESGMTDDQIRSEMGYTPQMSRTEAFKALRRVSEGKTTTGGKQTVSDANRERRMNRISQSARRNDDGTPKNDAARVMDLNTFYNQTGPDPLSEKTNREFMNDQQKREFDRYIGQVAYGRPNPDLEKRVMQTAKDIATDRARELETREAKDAKERLDAYIRNAATGEERQWATNLRTRLNALQTQIDESEEGDPVDQWKAERDALLNELTEGYSGAPPTPGQEENLSQHEAANDAAKEAGQDFYIVGGRKYRVQ